MERPRKKLPEDLEKRTKRFALRVINVVNALTRNRSADVIGRQLVRSGTSVGSNYRSARRAKSPADFISKMTTVEEEADESAYWMELLVEGKMIPAARLTALITEAYELVAITVASIRTAQTEALK